MSNRAWVTLATNDSYGLGALVLAHSLRRAGSAYPSVVLITPSVTEAMRERLRAVFAEVVTVDVLDSRDAAHLALLQRPELGITFTKIHCWNLTQYEKCVFLDADILVVQNCDELFEREELSAAPDVGWPDCFNSGVFVFTPSTETFNQLIAFARERGSFDGGDQGLLNSFFSDWARGDINKHLPFLYNVTSAAFYSYLPALKHYGQNLKVIHFIGAAKPWLQHFNWGSSTVDAPEHLREFLQLWWDLFVAQVHSQLDTSMVEVEEVPPVPPPEQPPHDVSPHYHYQPVLDPESEFPWHHPGAQIPEENLEERIDFTDINDPWEIYRGHIPPRSEQASTCHSVFERNEDQEAIRLYAWAYQSQNNNNKSNEHNVGHYEQLAHSASYNDNYQHNNDNERDYQEYIETQRYEQNHDPQILQDRYEPQTYHYSHEPQSYHNTTQHYEEHRHPPYIERSQHFQHEYEHQSNEEYCLYEQSIDDNPWYHQHYETQHNQKDRNVQNFQKDFEYIPSNIDSFENDNNTTYDSIYTEHNNIHQHHDTHEHSRHQHYNVENYPEKQYEYFDHTKQHYTHNYDQLSHQKQSFCVTEKIQNNEHCDTISENQSVSHSKSKNKEVFNLQVHQKKKRTHANRIHRIDFGISPPKMNGDISDTDSDASEEIIPRHPYDGFYLRHRAIIDSYGRKICTHEIPPVPPHSLSPPPQQVLELVNPERDQNLSSSGSENQSGVAGNLARVVPGSVSQGDALDELTRRQGWEAGNIDYMGADSFANIWAKISQTLSQPRTSPAKSPPRESTPSESAPMEDKPAEVSLETTTEPVEIAKEATEATTLAEVPAQTKVVAPLKTPAVSATAVEAAAKIEGTAPVHAATPGKAAVPVQEIAPTETAASVEPGTPVETTTAVETTAPADTIAPVKTVAPVENAAPVEISMPDVAPVKLDAPIEVATLVEAVAPIEAPKPTVEAPVTEPVKESTEKVTPDIPLTVEAAAPTVREIVETSAEITTPPEVPVTVKSSEAVQAIPTTEAPVRIPVEALQKTECIVPVATAPVAAKAPQAPSDIPLPVETVAEIPVPVETAPEAKKTESAETPAVQSEAVIVSAVEACPASPAVAAEAPEPALEATPPKAQSAPASDSPPLAHTPSKEEVPALPAAKSEERRKPAGKLQLSPPAAPDPLPTPDSEAEDAAALAHSIIASELQAAATPTPPTPVDRLTVEEPEVPTPPVGAVSLAQIGVKPVKGKPTIAAQIESSVAEKDDPAQAATAESPKDAAKVAPKDAPKEAPKKKVVKKVVKKESGASGAGGDAPVPPPRKKEKKPKEK